MYCEKKSLQHLYQLSRRGLPGTGAMAAQTCWFKVVGSLVDKLQKFANGKRGYADVT